MYLIYNAVEDTFDNASKMVLTNLDDEKIEEIDWYKSQNLSVSDILHAVRV